MGGSYKMHAQLSAVSAAAELTIFADEMTVPAEALFYRAG